ncbi:MAG TPA: VTT domain-containing protein [Candidatus Saccharimonadales bacterium]|nr:VTT domain-containing protein [Candidatus Saccharimonadales bacterium]
MLDPVHLLQGASVVTGLLLIGVIVFAETGLLIGFFLPGDTLLFTAGFFAAQGSLPLAGVLLVIAIGAVLGDNVGYTIGRKTGPKMFTKKDGLVFRRDHILRAEEFYEKHGGKTLIFARFIPVVRTFAPMVAGIGKMPRKRFMAYNVVGAVIWTLVITLLGYGLGNAIPSVDKYIMPALGLAMAITFGPTIIHLLRDKRLRTWLGSQLRRLSRQKRIDSALDSDK